MAICVALGVSLGSTSLARGSADPVTIVPDLPATLSAKPGPGMFLVANRALNDPYFGRSVVYLVEHDENGTLGLIVNRASNISLSEAVPDIEDEQAAAHALYYGGPVGQQMMLMLLRSESAAKGMAHVADDVYISSDRRVLEELLAAKKPVDELNFYIGHSGWGAGQLAFELMRDDWHVVAADTDAIFSGETDSLWDRLIERLEPIGIQVNSRPSLPSLAFKSRLLVRASPHFSPRSVARAPRCRCGGAHGPEAGAGVVYTTLSRPAGVRPATASISAAAAGGW